MRAGIVVIGSEILKGIVQDTNSYWLIKRLVELGYDVSRVIIVADSYDEISWAIKSSLEFVDVVIATGGLGFTRDDITLESVSRALGLELVFSSSALEMIKKRVGDDVSLYMKAAYIPRGGLPLYNSIGISPGVFLEVCGKYLFILPGVPREMIQMFIEYVEPVLRGLVERCVARVTVVTDYNRESDVDLLIAPLRDRFKDVFFKTHASIPVRLSIMVSCVNCLEVKSKLEVVLEELKKILVVRDLIIEV